VDTPLTTNKIILAAEDSAVAREVLTKFFKKLKANYEIYNDGELLMARLEELSPSEIGLVVTDIEMPHKDGYQVASFMKSSSLYSSIPIIVNSSMTTEAVTGKMKNIGVDEFVGKTDINSLYKAVRKYLS
jgi:two-component system chemotaxis response regulator CheV